MTYFPGLDDKEAAEVLGTWCQRHGIKADLQARTVDAGARAYQVIYLLLTTR